MKNQYVGDIGDYGKYGLLRFLAGRGIRIGVNWYLTKNDGSSDGRFTAYLERPDDRSCDPELFDNLKLIAFRNDKTVQMIRDTGLIPGARYYSDLVETGYKEPQAREWSRRLWFNNSFLMLADADLLFADPDNGITYQKEAKNSDSEKYVIPAELVEYYNRGKDVVFYCHKGRRKQADWEKTKTEMRRYLRDAQILVLTFHRGTQRSYIFLIHPDNYRKYDRLLSEFEQTAWGQMFSREPVAGNVDSGCESMRLNERKSGRYKVITLCGSTRFKDAFMEAQKRLTLEGNIVISVGLFGHSGDEEVWTEGTKEMLDDMHKQKIDMADEIYVINVGGYIGSSTRSEIEYAKAKGLPIRYLEETTE